MVNLYVNIWIYEYVKWQIYDMVCWGVMIHSLHWCVHYTFCQFNCIDLLVEILHVFIYGWTILPEGIWMNHCLQSLFTNSNDSLQKIKTVLKSNQRLVYRELKWTDVKPKIHTLYCCHVHRMKCDVFSSTSITDIYVAYLPASPPALKTNLALLSLIYLGVHSILWCVTECKSHDATYLSRVWHWSAFISGADQRGKVRLTFSLPIAEPLVFFMSPPTVE